MMLQEWTVFLDCPLGMAGATYRSSDIEATNDWDPPAAGRWTHEKFTIGGGWGIVV